MTERFLTIQARRDNKSTTVPKKRTYGFQKHIEKIKFKEREEGRGGGMIMARHSRDHKSTFTRRRI